MITSHEMRKLEDLSEKHGITKLMLMENAGRALFNEIKKRYTLEDKKILVVCGSGNNGGDGFVLAKYLYKGNYHVKVLFIGEENKLKKESGYNYWQLKELDAWISTGDYDSIKESDLIVDAIFGTGINGRIREPYSEAIDKINLSGKEIVSVDLPSGLDPDTGEVLDKVVNADLIITFHDMKPGLKKYGDLVVIADIGIPV